MKNTIIFNKIIFYLGYFFFKISGRNNHYSYIAFRRLFYKTGGEFNDSFSKKELTNKRGYKFRLDKSIIPNLTEKKVNFIAEEIKKNGFYLFDKLIDEKICNELIKVGLNSKCVLMPNPSGEENQIVDINNPKAIKYQIREVDLLKSKQSISLLLDEGFLGIAQKYLDTIPILDFVTMWWSFPSNIPSNEVAQMYHCDMDRFKFLKFFIYLTDVTPENGPHCYVKASHKVLPKPLRKDRRYNDSEIESLYPKENIIEFIGRKGSLIAIDTRGLHKGKHLNKRNRLLFQLEYTNSLFGSIENLKKFKVQNKEPFLEAMKKYPKLFHRKIFKN